MYSKLSDLLFLIGLFLVLIGAVVMGAFLLAPANTDLVQNIHVNRLGGSLLMGIGAIMLFMSFWNDRKALKK